MIAEMSTYILEMAPEKQSQKIINRENLKIKQNKNIILGLLKREFDRNGPEGHDWADLLADLNKLFFSSVIWYVPNCTENK